MHDRDERDVEILGHETAYAGYFRIEKYRLRHRIEDDEWSGEMVREVFERGHAAAVLPYDPVRDALVLVRQFRIGAYVAGRSPWLLEAVAGIIEDGEKAEDVVRREAQEEIGRPVSDLIPIYDYLVSPGGTSETVAVFLGRVDSDGAGGLHGRAEEHEHIHAVVRGYDEAMADLAAGRIDNAFTIIALQWLMLNRDEVRRRWR